MLLLFRIMSGMLDVYLVMMKIFIHDIEDLSLVVQIRMKHHYVLLERSFVRSMKIVQSD